MNVRAYALVTSAYWAFTITDGALRMLVLLHFHALGYDAIALAFLFVFYELFGVVTNLVGGYLAARLGLRVTLFGGLALQVLALCMLSLVVTGWPRNVSVAYVMAAQALSGIAKDLTKMSSKSSVKVLSPPRESVASGAGSGTTLFRWVAVLTGSKNALKGVGFFVGGLMLSTLGFRRALIAMAGALMIVLIGSVLSLPADMGRSKAKPKFRGIFSKSRAVNVLSGARLFLFGARDVWFVVGVPVFLAVHLRWSFTAVGTALALWVIGYGVIQSAAPALIARFTGGAAPQGRAALVLSLLLAVSMASIVVALHLGASPKVVVLGGLALFGAVFAVSSSVHSYLILAYSDGDEVAMNVGFYYMANAAGRLLGTLLSGVLYQRAGLVGCLWGSVAFALAAAAWSLALPRASGKLLTELKGETAAGD